MTVVMVTHERALAERYAQRMIFLADGKLVDDRPKLQPWPTAPKGSTVVKIPDLTELALRNLRESLLRNSLTTIGISVGVASLVAMLSLGIGLATTCLATLGEVRTLRHRYCYFAARSARHGP